jgi:phosphate starvation-inducible PhoH-like protein
MCLAEQIEVAPLAYMRGRNFHESIIIADELQNGSYIQIKTLVTRLGMNSRMIMNGDMDQSDLPTWKQGGLQVFIDKLAAIDKIGIVTMTNSDIVRNPLITEILAALDGNGV